MRLRNPIFSLILISFPLLSCEIKSKEEKSQFSLPAGYSLDQMEKVELPAELQEISGISWQEGDFLAIQDESTHIYQLDPATGAILNPIKNGQNQDIEDLIVWNDTAWLLRNNGDLFEVKNFRNEEGSTAIFEFPMSKKRDIEAIALSPDKKGILVFCKICDWEKEMDQSSVFRFDLETRQFDPKPMLVITKDQLGNLLSEKELKKLKIQPSAAAIHPVTREYYLLSSTGKWLMTLNQDLIPKSIHQLNSSIFGQPEGLTFASDGKLYISNEATKEKANLLIFKYKP